MAEKMYGWIGAVSSKITNKRRGRTNTAKCFKYFMKEEGIFFEINIRSNNLGKKDGVYYYILSIGQGQTTWAPYPFIEKVRPLCLILTQDIGSGNISERKGKVWTVQVDDTNFDGEKLIINGVELKKREGRNGSDYYSLSLGQVNEIRGNNEKPDYEFDSVNSIKEIIKKIVSKEK